MRTLKNKITTEKRRKAFFLTCFFVVSTEIAAETPAVVAVEGGAVVGKNAEGILQVDILPADQAGLSHNKYVRFNVDSDGLHLNNEGVRAHIILNEVTSEQRSLLQGVIEVKGPSADVIIANPNGITCNGCGFKNIEHGVLTTARPQFTDEKLTGFLVGFGDGRIDIQEKGMMIYRSAGIDMGKLSLIAKHIKINGNIHANDDGKVVAAKAIHIISGLSNRVHIEQGEDKKRITSLKVDPAKGYRDYGEGIDVGSLGGMYARQIYLFSNHSGIGVNSSATILPTEILFIDTLGNVDFKAPITSGGSIEIHHADTVRNRVRLAAKDNIFIQGVKTFINGESPVSLTSKATDESLMQAHDVLLFAQRFENYGKVNVHNKLNLTLDKDFINLSGQVDAADLRIVADNLIHKTHVFKGDVSQDQFQDTTGDIARLRGRSTLEIRTKNNFEMSGSEIETMLGSAKINVAGKLIVKGLSLDKGSLKVETVQKARGVSGGMMYGRTGPAAARVETRELKTKIVEQLALPARWFAQQDLSLTAQNDIHITGAVIHANKTNIESKAGSITFHPLSLVTATSEQLKTSEYSLFRNIENHAISAELRLRHFNTKFLFGETLNILAREGSIQFSDTDFLATGWFSENASGKNTRNSTLTLLAKTIDSVSEPDSLDINVKEDNHFFGIKAEGHSSIKDAIQHAKSHFEVQGGLHAQVRSSVLFGVQKLGDLSNLMFADTLGGTAGIAFGSDHKETHTTETSDQVSQIYADKISMTSTHGEIALKGVDIRTPSETGVIDLLSASSITLAEGHHFGKMTLDSKGRKVDLSTLASANAYMKAAGAGARVGYSKTTEHEIRDQRSHAPFSLVAKIISLYTGWDSQNNRIDATKSGAHVQLLGGKIAAKEVLVAINGDLAIKSLQDTQDNHTSENHWGGSLGLDVNTYTKLGINGGLNGGLGRSSDEFAMVGQQAGIVSHKMTGVIKNKLHLVGSHMIQISKTTSAVSIPWGLGDWLTQGLSVETIHGESIADHSNKDGYYLDGGIGINVNGLPMINASANLPAWFKYKNVQKATISGVMFSTEVAHQGEVNTDPNKLTQVLRQDSNSAVDITANFAFSPKKGNKKETTEDTHPVKKALAELASKVEKSVDSAQQRVNDRSSKYRLLENTLDRSVLRVSEEIKTRISRWEAYSKVKEDGISKADHRQKMLDDLGHIQVDLDGNIRELESVEKEMRQLRREYEDTVITDVDYVKHDQNLKVNFYTKQRNKQVSIDQLKNWTAEVEALRARLSESKIALPQDYDQVNQSLTEREILLTGEQLEKLPTQMARLKVEGTEEIQTPSTRMEWTHPVTHELLTVAPLAGTNRVAFLKSTSPGVYREVHAQTGRVIHERHFVYKEGGTYYTHAGLLGGTNTRPGTPTHPETSASSNTETANQEIAHQEVTQSEIVCHGSVCSMERRVSDPASDSAKNESNDDNRRHSLDSAIERAEAISKMQVYKLIEKKQERAPHLKDVKEGTTEYAQVFKQPLRFSVTRKASSREFVEKSAIEVANKDALKVTKAEMESLHSVGQDYIENRFPDAIVDMAKKGYDIIAFAGSRADRDAYIVSRKMRWGAKILSASSTDFHLVEKSNGEFAVLASNMHSNSRLKTQLNQFHYAGIDLEKVRVVDDIQHDKHQSIKALQSHLAEHRILSKAAIQDTILFVGSVGSTMKGLIGRKLEPKEEHSAGDFRFGSELVNIDGKQVHVIALKIPNGDVAYDATRAFLEHGITKVVMNGAGGRLSGNGKIGDYMLINEVEYNGDTIKLSDESFVMPKEFKHYSVEDPRKSITVDSPLDETNAWLDKYKSYGSTDVESYHIMKAVNERAGQGVKMSVVPGLFISDVVGEHPLIDKLVGSDAGKHIPAFASAAVRSLLAHQAGW